MRLNLTTEQHVAGYCQDTKSGTFHAKNTTPQHTPSSWLVWHSDCIASRVCFECPASEWRYELFKKEATTAQQKKSRKGGKQFFVAAKDEYFETLRGIQKRPAVLSI